MEEGIPREAQRYIKNILRYMKKDAKDIMTHRRNIVAIDGDQKLEDAVRFMMENNYSRFPVYINDIDEIIGFIHIREAVKNLLYSQKEKTRIKDLGECLRSVKFIPETRAIDNLFQKMQKEKVQIVIVLDEYGQTSGLVTVEDILEEIVGNIEDEYDEEDCDIVHQEDGSIVVDGMSSLDDLEDMLSIPLKKDDFETLNGFIINFLDRIPSEDEDIEFDYMEYHFHVLEVSENTIQRVRIEKKF